MARTLTSPYFISLDPDPAIAEAVRRFKRQTRQLVGSQMYLADPPHMTCYLAHFSESKPLIAAVAKLAESISELEINIVGWHTFERDQLTGNNTLVLDFDDSTRARLRVMQSRLIDAISLLRDRTATRAHYGPRWGALSDEQRWSVETYGFPFTGEGWHPHLTIASIRPDNWLSVAGSVLREKPAMTGACCGLTVYRLEGIEPVAIAAFAIRRSEAHV